MYLIISLLYVCSFFSPLGMAPVVGLVGLGLFQRGFPVVGSMRGIYCKLWFTSWTLLPLKYGIVLSITSVASYSENPLSFYACPYRAPRDLMRSFSFSAGRVCGNWFAHADTGHWIITSKS